MWNYLSLLLIVGGTTLVQAFLGDLAESFADTFQEQTQEHIREAMGAVTSGVTRARSLDDFARSHVNSALGQFESQIQDILNSVQNITNNLDYCRRVPHDQWELMRNVWGMMTPTERDEAPEDVVELDAHMRQCQDAEILFPTSLRTHFCEFSFTQNIDADDLDCCNIHTTNISAVSEYLQSVTANSEKRDDMCEKLFECSFMPPQGLCDTALENTDICREASGQAEDRARTFISSLNGLLGNRAPNPQECEKLSCLARSMTCAEVRKLATCPPETLLRINFDDPTIPPCLADFIGEKSQQLLTNNITYAVDLIMSGASDADDILEMICERSDQNSFRGFVNQLNLTGRVMRELRQECGDMMSYVSDIFDNLINSTANFDDEMAEGLFEEFIDDNDRLLQLWDRVPTQQMDTILSAVDFDWEDDFEAENYLDMVERHAGSIANWNQDTIRKYSKSFPALSYERIADIPIHQFQQPETDFLAFTPFLDDVQARVLGEKIVGNDVSMSDLLNLNSRGLFRALSTRLIRTLTRIEFLSNIDEYNMRGMSREQLCDLVDLMTDTDLASKWIHLKELLECVRPSFLEDKTKISDELLCGTCLGNIKSNHSLQYSIHSKQLMSVVWKRCKSALGEISSTNKNYTADRFECMSDVVCGMEVADLNKIPLNNEMDGICKVFERKIDCMSPTVVDAMRKKVRDYLQTNVASAASQLTVDKVSACASFLAVCNRDQIKNLPGAVKSYLSTRWKNGIEWTGLSLKCVQSTTAEILTAIDVDGSGPTDITNAVSWTKAQCQQLVNSPLVVGLDGPQCAKCSGVAADLKLSSWLPINYNCCREIIASTPSSKYETNLGYCLFALKEAEVAAVNDTAMSTGYNQLKKLCKNLKNQYKYMNAIYDNLRELGLENEFMPERLTTTAKAQEALGRRCMLMFKSAPSITQTGSGRRKKRATSAGLTCSSIKATYGSGSGSGGYESITASEITAMADAEFKQCIPEFGKEDQWNQGQLDALVAKLKRTGVWGSSLSAWTSDELVLLGCMAGGLTTTEITTMTRISDDPHGVMASVLKCSTLSQSKLSAAYTWARTGLGKTHATLSTTDLSLLGHAACGPASTDIKTFSKTAYKDAATHIGQAKWCSTAQKSAYMEVATHASAFGPTSTWSSSQATNIGSMIGGLSAAEFQQLSASAISGIPSVHISTIPADVLKVMSNSQIDALSSSQAAQITAEQYNAFPADKKTKLAAAGVSSNTVQDGSGSGGNNNSGSGMVSVKALLIVPSLITAFIFM